MDEILQPDGLEAADGRLLGLRPGNVPHRHGRERAVVEHIHVVEQVKALEHHADVPPQGAHVHVLIENAAAVIAHLPGNPHRGDQVVHAVQGFQKGGLSAAGGPDEGRDVLFGDGHVDPLQGMGISVPELQIFRRNNITHTLLLLAKYLPASEAEKLIISVKNIKIAAMAKAAPNSPSSLAYT